MGSFGLSVDRSNSACVIVRDTELQVGFLHGMAIPCGAVLHPSLLSPRHAVSRDVCRMSPAVLQRPGTSPTQSSRSSLSFPSSTEKTIPWDTVWKFPRPQITILAALLFLSFRFLSRFCFLTFVGFLPCLYLLRSLVVSVLCYRLVPFLLLPLGLLPARLVPHSSLSDACCLLPALPIPVRSSVFLSSLSAVFQFLSPELQTAPSCSGSNSKAWAEDQILEVNGEPCTGEDISSKLEDKDVQDGPSRTGRFDAECVPFA